MTEMLLILIVLLLLVSVASVPALVETWRKRTSAQSNQGVQG